MWRAGSPSAIATGGIGIRSCCDSKDIDANFPGGFDVYLVMDN
jgi:hypothetical protein